MSREQIEEMAKATMKHCKIDNQCGSCHWTTCNECLSEVLYNAGYRKASEVAVVEAHWIERKVRMWAKGGKPYFGYEQECSHCGCINKSKKRWSSKFCFECGAKMQKEE